MGHKEKKKKEKWRHWGTSVGAKKKGPYMVKRMEVVATIFYCFPLENFATTLLTEAIVQSFHLIIYIFIFFFWLKRSVY